MSVPKLIVVGAGGQVGRQLCAAYPSAVPVTRREVDLTRPETIANLARFAEPGAVVVNVAAFTSVDAAEAPENAREVELVNAQAPGELARVCRRAGMRFIHVSTDYVFSGTVPAGRCNAEGDVTAPVNEYGRSKRAGELAALLSDATVVRTSWVYSGPRNVGGDFVKTMWGLANKGVDPSVVADQWGRPTRAADLARALGQLAGVPELPDVLHVAGEGEPVTWCDFARAVFQEAGFDPSRVAAIPTSEYPTPAQRPLNATLCLDRWHELCASEIGVSALPAWQDSLREVLR